MARIKVQSEFGGVFARCSSREVERVRRRGVEVTVAPGTVIHPRNAQARWVYIVLSGRAVVTEGGASRSLWAGDVFGAREVLSHDIAPELSLLTSAAETSVLTLPARDFADLLDECAGFAHGLARHLANTPYEDAEKAPLAMAPTSSRGGWRAPILSRAARPSDQCRQA